MKKVLIIYNKIWPYRELIFNTINKEHDLTVAFSDKQYCEKSYSFKTLYLPIKKIGPFDVHKDKLEIIASEFDVVIGISNIRWISLMLLAFKRRRNYKIGYWGIGVTASYTSDFDSSEILNKIRYYISKKSDFTIFYSDYPVQKYLNAGVSENKLYVAHNSVAVKTSTKNSKLNKVNFLFIGTLYPQKGLEVLLEAYKELRQLRNDVPQLLIVGEGPQRNVIELFVKVNNLSNWVKLLGRIYDDTKLEEIFNMSRACISPNQAGLSVLKSMGNRTIFVTSKYAITGGEIFNIENNVNGILYNKNEDLVEVLSWILDNPKKNRIMNDNAYAHYHNFRTPEMMAKSICNAIENNK
ncbi:glycosyltransferase family 4 protein [Aequorivita marisscotiae]|uniref:Glycosyltransferase family 4 protein n=1 Tax=Aequorivita marisscotiae TaxID=3040348 RepID=A0ABY8KWH4_9FLAO|nr:glycosyltransferase family 4 protein [Aequorivita sp. Ant34-E75]WGF92212.1 glycosyltransferase family 4 protein [Aequorivita sp. Ant34-E75]